MNWSKLKPHVRSRTALYFFVSALTLGLLFGTVSPLVVFFISGASAATVTMSSLILVFNRRLSRYVAILLTIFVWCNFVVSFVACTTHR